MVNPLISKLGSVVALTADDRQVLEAICSNRQIIAEQKDIIREGQKPEHIHILLDGWAACYKMLPDGSRQITAFVLPGDMFGASAPALNYTDHSVVTLTPVTIAKITRNSLLETTREHPILAQAFWWACLVDEAILRTWIVNLGRRNAYARVAHLICELHARIGRTGLAEGEETNLPLTQTQLADALGLTSVHINRTLKRLRLEGILRTRKYGLTIDSVERLQAAAGFQPDYLY